uniref:Predicted protein n=1 Tax=Hordeum vulgare subsp. vulgare TaxID=112509 RepID=F2EER0_HORVV|nr:predicted protein [Hordeum vulgare subsp. vulgare]
MGDGNGWCVVSSLEDDLVMGDGNGWCVVSSLEDDLVMGDGNGWCVLSSLEASSGGELNALGVCSTYRRVPRVCGVSLTSSVQVSDPSTRCSLVLF